MVDLFGDGFDFAVNFLVSDPKTIHLGAVSGGDKGLDLVLADERHDGRELVLGQQGLNLYMFLSTVTACYII